MMKCAIYARFSSDRQNITSIADQIRKCRQYAESQGWRVLEDHIYCDEAKSGTSTERIGLQKLVAAATDPARPFDCILLDDTSRLTRKLADALNLYERLTFAGIRLVAVSQGLDSENAQAELLIGFHGLIDNVYWRELGQKTHRGMERNALGGLHTGGRCFGYIRVKDPNGNSVLEVSEPEAAIVRRIFTLYATGLSLKRIAHLLNDGGIPAPQPQKGRFSRSWCVSSIRVILKNPRYIGKPQWNTRRKVRVPGTAKRVYRPRPEAEWIIGDIPQQCIVSDELFQAVQRRFEDVKKLWGREGGRPGLASGQQRQVYLFSGLLKCGSCGGSITLVSGRGRSGSDKYGCSVNHQRGNAVCSNSLTIRRGDLESRLLRNLSESVLCDEVLDYAVAGLAEELERHFRTLDSELERLRQRKQEIEAEISRLVQAIAGGRDSSPLQSIMAAITERETELKTITDRILEQRPGSLRVALDKLRTFAVSRLTDLRKLVSQPESVHQARALLAEDFGAFVMTPVVKNGKAAYAVQGEIDFFGEEAMMRVGGAGGQS